VRRSLPWRRLLAVVALLLVAAAAAAVVLAAPSGDADDPPARPATRAERPDASPAPPAAEPRRPAPRRELAIGLTEANANLLFTSQERPDVGALGPWRDRVAALRPRYFRLPVDWSQLQPSSDAQPQWELPADGCQRGGGPCAGYAGIRDVLRAVRSQQQATGGWEILVSLYGIPAWAARAPGGCERPDTGPRSRPITDSGLDGYRALIRSLLALARAEGVPLRWWTPWNEPNGPFFVSPQRQGCSTNSTALAPGVYTRLARALRAELEAEPAEQGLVVGELADYADRRRYGASIPEFYDALPDDVVCSASVYSQHAYAQRGQEADDPGAVGQLKRTLADRPCSAGKPIWVTETGVGGAHVGDRRSGGPATQRADCRAMATALSRWRRDPRVTAAFQYTFRDDPLFPVGLADVSLTRAWPAYDLWLAWGGERDPSDPEPELPGSCAP
jgi:hypothetical protein